MSYASLAAPVVFTPVVGTPVVRTRVVGTPIVAVHAIPTRAIPVRAIQKTAGLMVQSLGVAATLWVLLAAPGFLTDRTGLRSSTPVVASR